jgi:hypothetical protein
MINLTNTSARLLSIDMVCKERAAKPAARGSTSLRRARPIAFYFLLKSLHAQMEYAEAALFSCAQEY